MWIAINFLNIVILKHIFFVDFSYLKNEKKEKDMKARQICKIQNKKKEKEQNTTTIIQINNNN